MFLAALGGLSKIWPQLAIAAIAIMILIGAYQSGVNAERNRGEAASLRIEIQTLKRDKEIADRALVRVADDTAELEALRRTDEEKIAQLQDIIRDRADRGLNQRELDGLLNIR